MVGRGAKEIGVPQISRDEIHYTDHRKRQVHAGLLGIGMAG